MIGEEERDRLETQWKHASGAAAAARCSSPRVALQVQLLQSFDGRPGRPGRHEGDAGGHCQRLSRAARFLTSETNLANLQAAEHQHMAKAISPRLQRRDEKLNEQLVPLFDPSGRLFLASEDPVPVNRELNAQGTGTKSEIRRRDDQRDALRARPGAGAVGRCAVAAAATGEPR